jgi:HPt (histidine-containing phosphotransfer) domain-containing protein
MSETASSETRLFSRLGGDPDLSELVEMFVDEMPNRTAALREQFNGGDLEGLRRLAHQLKGAAGSYGFDSITPAAARLEAAIRDEESVAHVRAALDELLDLCNRVRAGTPGQ